MLSCVKKYLPAAYGAALNLYHGDSTLFLHADPSAEYSRAISEQGVHQGCVFGTIFFSIAIRELTYELSDRLRLLHPRNNCSFFADDGNLQVRREHAAIA